MEIAWTNQLVPQRDMAMGDEGAAHLFAVPTDDGGVTLTVWVPEDVDPLVRVGFLGTAYKLITGEEPEGEWDSERLVQELTLAAADAEIRLASQ